MPIPVDPVLMATVLTAPVFSGFQAVLPRRRHATGLATATSRDVVQQHAFEAYLAISSRETPGTYAETHRSLMEDFQSRCICRDPQLLGVAWRQMESYARLLSTGKLI